MKLTLAVSLFAALCPCTTQVAAAADRWSPARFGLRDAGLSATAIDVRWRDVPLRQAIDRIQRATSIDIFLDRRVNPTRLVTLVERGTPSRLLESIATANDLGVAELGGALYLGPKESAEMLRTVHARAYRSLATSGRAALRNEAPLSWPRLSDPGDTIGRVVEAAGVRIAGLDRLPHDRWDAGGLGSATIAEQLTLLLFGFGYEWRASPSGDGLEIRPIEQPVTVTATHRAASGMKASKDAFLDIAPDAELKVRGRTWTLTAGVEAHEKLAAYLRTGSLDREYIERPSRGTTAATAAGDEIANKRLTLSVSRQPAGVVLEQVCKSLGVPLKVDRGAAARLEARVDLRLENARFEELLDDVSRQCGVLCRLVEGAVRVEKPTQ